MGKKRKSSKNRERQLIVLAAKVSLLASILTIVSELIRMLGSG